VAWKETSAQYRVQVHPTEARRDNLGQVVELAEQRCELLLSLVGDEVSLVHDQHVSHFHLVHEKLYHVASIHLFGPLCHDEILALPDRGFVHRFVVAQKFFRVHHRHQSV